MGGSLFALRPESCRPHVQFDNRYRTSRKTPRGIGSWGECGLTRLEYVRLILVDVLSQILRRDLMYAAPGDAHSWDGERRLDGSFILQVRDVQVEFFVGPARRDVQI